MALDEKSKKQLIMIGVLCVVMLFAFVNSIFKVKNRHKGGGGEAHVEEPASEPHAETPAFVPERGSRPVVTMGAFDEESRRLQLASLERPWGRDPFFMQEIILSARETSLDLQGISWRPDGKSYAIVNGEILQTGDMYERNIIVEIEARRVLLEREGRRYILSLQEGE
ncbi:MAG: hypothetical protein JW937_04965 [Candidatus Omnitrophica bacterium]|nr:hypothetical protein [Candidatus Omnitrophota bacterium]